jgi:hypothetical protein
VPAEAGDGDACKAPVVQPADEALERLHRQGVLAGTRDRLIHHRADAQREQVVFEHRSIAKAHGLVARVDRLHFALLVFRMRAPGQAAHVDLDFAQAVVAGDQARQHSRVDLPRLRRDEHEARAVKRLLDELLQDHQVRVAGADEQDFLHAWPVFACSCRRSSRLRSSLRCTLPVVVIGSASMNSISRGYS